MSEYLKQVQLGMDILAAHPCVVFVGQAMKYKGHAATRQVERYPLEKRIEFPVMEDSQAGFCLGLALQGYIPVCIYPRNDFAILALNQIINHIDKASLMGYGHVKVIIKILVGAKTPLDGGHQHTGNYIKAITDMCSTIGVYDIKEENTPNIQSIYQRALNSNNSIIINEYTELYQ